MSARSERAATALAERDEIDRLNVADVARAKARGERVLGLCNDIIARLDLYGYLHGVDTADLRREMFHVIADDLFGHLPVDIPNLEDAKPYSPERRV